MRQEHYYTAEPTSAGRPGEVVVTAGGRQLALATEAGVFSRGRVDPGTRLLMKALAPLLPAAGSLLDLGCGYGPVGLWAAVEFPHLRVELTDINRRAVELCRRNIERNGVTNAVAHQGEGYQALAGRRFDVIATNPPIRAGVAVIRTFVAGAPAHLRPGGSFLLVARTSQGARSLAALMAEHLADVTEIEKGSGYRVYRGRPPAPE